MARPARQFHFRLAAELGMTVRELLARMDSRELSEWMAFDRIEPIGSGRANLALAGLSAITANVNRDSKRHPEPYAPDAFVAFFLPLRQGLARPVRAATAAARRFKDFLLSRS